jgi:hypothetical protein
MAIQDAIAGVIGPIVDGFLKFIPDKNERARAKEAFESQMLNAMTGLVQGQLEINKEQAKHPSVFVAGARPFLLWVCGVAFAWQFIGQPMTNWAFLIWQPATPVPPSLDIGPLMSLTLGMLGLGGLRTYEKRLGVARESIGEKK